MIDTKRLRELMKESEWKLAYFCEALGLSKMGLNNKVVGTKPFTLPEVESLCELLHLDAKSRDEIFFAKESTYEKRVYKKETL